MTETAEEPLAGVAVLPVIDVDGGELLTEFTAVMLEWGHHRTAAGLRFPTLAEARAAGAGRREDRSRSRCSDGTWHPLSG